MERSLNSATLNSLVTFRISRLNTKLNQQATKVLANVSSISLSQWRVVTMLAQSDGPQTASDLIETAAFDKALISRAVKSLIADGLVRQTVDAKDKRRTPLSLTEEGRAVFDRVFTEMNARQKHLVHNLDEDERRQFFSLLEKIETNSTTATFRKVTP